jgi:granule-bound starch synthase
VHNIAFQGRFWPASMEELGLPESAAADFFFEDHQSKMFDERSPIKDDGQKLAPTAKKYRKDNWMKAAFINSDRNITVSMNYAKEIAGTASKGVELNTVINATGGIEGIVNGMDPTEW